MADLSTERENLAKAESDIAEGERRITAQAVLIERLRRDNHETAEAEKLLLSLQQTLDLWNAHRDEILYQIGRLEGRN